MSKIAATLLFLLLGATSVAGQMADVLTGRVVGPGGQPLADVQVEAVSLDTEISRTVLTGANGRYTIIFPDGGGRYLMRVSYLGMADVLRAVFREGNEDLLIANYDLSPQAIALEAIQVRAQLPPPGRLAAGERRTTLPLEYLTRLPLADMDPETVAQLAAGVIALEADSLNGRARFSVGGMGGDMNQIRLDGSIVGEETGGFGAPQEGVRMTQVTTSSFDVSRGGFAGGQVQLLSQRGNNRSAGSASYSIDDAGLQIRTSPAATAMTRHNLGGSYGGPIVQNRLFYNMSFQLTRNLDHRFALATHDPLAAQRSGVAADSISRFLGIMTDRYGFGGTGATGEYNQRNDDVRLQGRVDWTIVQSPTSSQTLTVRGNMNMNRQDSTRINVLDVSHHGGDAVRDNLLAGVTLTSRFGQNWTSTFNASFGRTQNDAVPYVEMPEGQVRITSDFDDGSRGTRNVIFGGNRNMPTEAYNRDFQMSEEVSFLLPLGSTQIHRIKVGGSVQRLRDVARSTDNLFGTFTYASLADFEDNRPDRYERSLSARETETGRFLAALYVGDSWRVTAPLELTLGLRWDYSSYDQRPAFNPAVEDVFGRRTDEMPLVNAFSPRLGFNYRLSPQVRGARMRALSGGIGVFAGRAPTNIFSTALRQTGLPDAEQRLICIGGTVPVPDWDLYLRDPQAVPTACADGGLGSSTQSSRAPTVTVIAPDQTLPTSLRTEIGYRAPLPLNMDANVRYTYNRGFGLWGYRDLNLNDAVSFNLTNEDRPFFGDEMAIVQRTGSVSLVSSRRDRAFGSVFEVASDRSSAQHQLSLQANGRIRPPTQVNLNYTLSHTQDNGSGAFTQVPTAGNPNDNEWATAGTDRRHTFNISLTHALRPEIEIAATTRVQSGLPFTPIVNRDINGDGARNDRAYIFDPAAVEDTMLANGMTRLLPRLPGRVRVCLEEQLGSIAERNSCRESWTQGLDVRASFRPSLPRVERRLTVSLDARNVLTGLDAAIHGRANAKGWGEGQRAENILLNVRGYDRATHAFRYEVNEAFGEARRGANSARNAFSVTMQGRLLVGGQPNQANRGFGQQQMMAGGFGGGGQGGLGTNVAQIYGPFTPLLRSVNATTNADSVLDAAFTNPLRGILNRRETEGLSAVQTTQLIAVTDSLDVRLQAHRAAAAEALLPLLAERATMLEAARARAAAAQGQSGQGAPAGQASQGQRSQGGQQAGQGQAGQGQRGQGQSGQGQGGQAGQQRPGGGQPPALLGRYQSELQPLVEGAARDISEALRTLRESWSPEQWQRLPQELRRAADRPSTAASTPAPQASGT
jgi:hypothetical protein